MGPILAIIVDWIGVGIVSSVMLRVCVHRSGVRPPASAAG